MKLNIDQLRELIQLLEDSKLTEIEVQNDDERIRLRRDPSPTVGTSLIAAPVAAATPAPSAGPTPTPAADEGTYVTSPFVGTFYRASSPENDPFVELGDTISPGQTLCIVEAMKLMNEIEAEAPGKIVEILVDNGKPVEYGDKLFRIETS
ncbi:MAG: acetyl-CoA carboxylase biotin carboxyl carrier protein [Myxococcota bacterium]